MLTQFNISLKYKESQINNNGRVLYSVNMYSLYVGLIKQNNVILFLGFPVVLYLGYSVASLLD